MASSAQESSLHNGGTGVGSDGARYNRMTIGHANTTSNTIPLLPDRDSANRLIVEFRVTGHPAWPRCATVRMSGTAPIRRTAHHRSQGGSV